jgi:hypothetical protein
MEANPGFSIFAKSGFQIRFENGWTVSVQFGPTHYCSNRNMDDLNVITKMFKPEPLAFGDEFSCANAEVAVWDAKGDYHTFDGDLSKGWVKPAEVLTILNEIAAK